MSPAIFIDTNVPIYAAGRPHPLKSPCAEVLLVAAEKPAAFVTDAEVFQELLHRYLALHLWAEGRDVFGYFADLMRERVEAVHLADVEHAVALTADHPDLSGRDLLHAAVMLRLGISQIVTADRDFDRIPGIRRLDPALIHAWQDSVGE